MSPTFWGKRTALFSVHLDLAAVSLDTDRSVGVRGTWFPRLHLFKGRCLVPCPDSQPLPPDSACPLTQPPLTLPE